jgi:hypothetical protein
MSHEKGIAPVPRIALLKDSNLWAPWAKWFERLVEAIYRIRTYSPSIDVASVAANSESVQTFTVTGLSTADIVTVNKQSNDAGLDLVQAWVSAENTLSLKYRNHTGAAIDPASETYLITAIRS